MVMKYFRIKFEFNYLNYDVDCGIHLFPDEWNSKLTPLGEAMAAFPVAPRFAKMLCLSQQHNLLPYTVAIVAALSVREFLLDSNDQFQKLWRSWAGSGNTLLLGSYNLAHYCNGSKYKILAHT